MFDAASKVQRSQEHLVQRNGYQFAGIQDSAGLSTGLTGRHFFISRSPNFNTGTQIYRYNNYQELTITAMSSAFVREGDHQELSDIAPTINALISFLTSENGGIRVYEKKREEKTGGTIHQMSNGLGYRLNASNKWEVVV